MRFRFVFCALLIAFCGFTLQAQVVAYVANNQDNTVSVIDVATNAEVAVIPVVSSPYAVAATPDGGTVYVASASSGVISVINTSTNTASTHFIGAVTVFAPAVTPDGQYLWVPTDVGIYIFRTSDLGYVDQLSAFAIGLAFDPATKLAYGVSIGQVYVMNWSTRTVLGALPVQTGNYQIVPSQPIALLARSNFAWVTGGLGNPLTAIFRYSASVVGSIPMGLYTGDVAIAPNNSKVFATDPFSDTVNILSLSTFVVDPAPLSVAGPAGLALTPDSASLYVVSGTGTVSVFSTATKALTATIPVGNGPYGIALFRLKAPFSNFTSKQLHLTNRKVSVTGSLTLGANGVLDFSTQDVVVRIGDATVVIPAGEVKQGGAGHYIFNGKIDGQTVKFSLDADPGSTTTFTYHVQIQDFTTPLPNPVTVTVSIGSNTGTMTVSY
jgi:YVTN family beta-propeller protein